ncbi:MAG: MurR/RpiR family transcriptional regulator [Lachnospiraceae bacterium]|nr:MurR/RpiR family transcriptional regulator [Lachnospiraceae bacterium]
MENLNLLQRINQKYVSFSKGQKRLADYITKNYDIAAYLTASKLGKEAGVSESTVVRFAYQLEYEGYPELQKAMQVIVKTNSDSMQRMTLSSKRYEKSGVLKSILTTDAERLRDTIHNGIEQAEFDQAVQMINNSNKVYILGARSAGYLAGLLGYYLKQLVDNVVVVDAMSTSETLEQIINIGDNDLMIGVTFPRYSKRTIVALQYAKDHGSKTIALTDSKQSPIVEYADCSLIARSDVMTIVDSLVCPLSIVNALVSAVALLRREEIQKRLMGLEELWKEYDDVYNKSSH